MQLSPETLLFSHIDKYPFANNIRHISYSLLPKWNLTYRLVCFFRSFSNLCQYRFPLKAVYTYTGLAFEIDIRGCTCFLV